MSRIPAKRRQRAHLKLSSSSCSNCADLETRQATLVQRRGPSFSQGPHASERFAGSKRIACE